MHSKHFDNSDVEAKGKKENNPEYNKDD